MNLYGYTANDPVNNTDPTGLFEKGDSLRRIYNVARAYTRPAVNSNAKPKTVTRGQAKKAQKQSEYESAEVSKADKKEVKGIMKSKEFKGQAKQIYKDSKEGERELGALAVYENEDGEYDIYSVGVPNPKISNRMSLDLPEDAGRLVFTWHPHPWGNRSPSPADIRTSASLGVPGVVRYGSSRRNRTVYRGRRKVSN